MTLRICSCLLATGILLSACRKKPEPDSPATRTPPAPVAVAPEPDPNAPPPPPVPSAADVGQGNKLDLVALNKIFKSYCATLDNGKPRSLGELVAAGYMEKLPDPPKGKKLVIDYKKMEIVLEND